MSRSAGTLFVRLSARQLRRHPYRTLLVLVSLAIGVALLVCIRATGRSAELGLVSSLERSVGRAQLQVVALDAGGMPEQVLARVRDVASVARAVAVVEVRGRIADQPGRSILIMALDLTDGATTDFYDAQVSGEVVDDALAFLARKDSLVLSTRFAERNCLGPGALVPLLTAHGRRELTVRGLLVPGPSGSALGGDVALMDIVAAQELFGKTARLDRIDVELVPGADLAAATSQLRDAVGATARVVTPAARGPQVEQMLLSFRVMTDFIGVIALCAAAFLIFSVTTIAVRQRRREIGTLRALGATQGELLQLFAVEGAIAGTIGALAGIALGVWLAGIVARTFAVLAEASFRRELDLAPPSYSPSSLGFAFIVGVTATAVAAVLAARRATRQPITTALHALPPPEAARTSQRHRMTAAVALALLAALTLLLQQRSRLFLVGGLTDPLLLLAVFLATPVLIVTMAPLLLAPARALFGTPALLALRSIARHGEQLATTVTILTIGLYVLVTVGAVIESFERSVLDWIRKAWGAELAVTAAGTYSRMDFVPLDQAFGDALAGVPGVARVRPFRVNHVTFGDVEINVRAWQLGTPPTAEDLDRFTFVRGSADEAVPAVHSEDAALVSQSFARRFALGRGDRFRLPTPGGGIELAIAGVVTDYDSSVGTVVIRRELYERLWTDRLVDAFEVALAPGASPQDVRERIQERFASRFDVVVLDVEGRVAVSRALMAQAFLPLRAVEVVVLAIALLSLLNALVVSVAERFREFGTLRALGAGTRQVVATVILEAVAATGIAGLCGIALGLLGSRAWILIQVPAATGWVIQYSFPLATIASATAAAIVLAIAAAAYPARLAARLPVVAALRAAER